MGWLTDVRDTLARIEPGSYCEYYGLPPCCDYYPSFICHASADTTGAIPVLEVLW